MVVQGGAGHHEGALTGIACGAFGKLALPFTLYKFGA